MMLVEKRPQNTIFVGNRDGYTYYISLVNSMIYVVKGEIK